MGGVEAMNLWVENFARGFLILLPFLVTMLITVFAISVVYYVSKKVAQDHIIKYHIPELLDEATKGIVAENARYRLLIKKLTADNKEFAAALSGVRYLVRQGAEYEKM